ncbi:outer membrane beta-barrel protein [Chitinophaga oryziterrae]|uniref:Outer membrane beta-barrel protein n=2 Tax=Chitinophaga oryziterrae TaxID=1031224 RepID=A0A6N8J464_9BACT|nr:PorT family protein [Chitinophaga oryziterrae]MVT39823.1 outer membrane beta-barrel protein [Chitinophaga oryziterrae]
MQLLDDDMDELFRNAASQYPLKTDGQDWDAVMRRLSESSASEKKPASSFNRLLRWFWRPMLALLVLGVSIPSLKTGDLVPHTEAETGVTNNVVVPVTETTSKTVVGNNDVPVAEKVSKTGIDTRIKKQKINNNIYAPVIVANSANNNIVNKSIPERIVNNTTGITLSGADNDIVPPLSIHVLPSANAGEWNISAALQPVKQPVMTTSSVVEKMNVPVKVQKGLYAGIVASPDISTVKLQHVSKVGYNAGIVVGYRISRRVAVETGVLLERKYYYSDGSHFSTKKIPVPSDMKIINVDGWCNMIEIPVTVRYVFGIKEKSNWYVNGGLTSYIMNRESYAYKYEMNNWVDTKTWDYKNSTRNWFSIIHAGVGYEHRLGAVGTLRVEPYLNIPTGGVGVGNLPITSVGLNVGITRPIRF